jgi:hypothetical protein
MYRPTLSMNRVPYYETAFGWNENDILHGKVKTLGIIGISARRPV